MRSKSNITIFSSKSVERVAGTTIAEQMGEGVADVVAAFFGEDVENIKVRTYKMRLPGMKTADESGDRIGLSFFSAGWCEVSGRECQIHGLWRVPLRRHGPWKNHLDFRSVSSLLQPRTTDVYCQRGRPQRQWNKNGPIRNHSSRHRSAWSLPPRRKPSNRGLGSAVIVGTALRLVLDVREGPVLAYSLIMADCLAPVQLCFRTARQHQIRQRRPIGRGSTWFQV